MLCLNINLLGLKNERRESGGGQRGSKGKLDCTE